MPNVEDLQTNVDLCLKFCGTCPTYSSVMSNPDEEALFCSRGKSSVPKIKQGCNCAECDVQHHYGCTSFYYCMEGAC